MRQLALFKPQAQMRYAAFEVAGLLAAALEHGAVQTETAAALHELGGRAGLVVRYVPLANALFDAFCAACSSAACASCAAAVHSIMFGGCVDFRGKASWQFNPCLLSCLPLRVRVSGSAGRTVSRADSASCVLAAAQQPAPDASTAAAQASWTPEYTFDHT